MRPRPTWANRALTFFLQGWQALEKADNATAVQNLQKAVAVDESNAASRVLLAKAYIGASPTGGREAVEGGRCDGG